MAQPEPYVDVITGFVFGFAAACLFCMVIGAV